MTKAKWWDVTWNYVSGCHPISDGCKNCYAQRMSKRLVGRFGYPKDDPFRPGITHDTAEMKPFLWTKPRRIFVCSMGDLFHDAVSYETLKCIFNIMRMNLRHRFIILTKRPKRMREVIPYLLNDLRTFTGQEYFTNIDLGVTVENNNEMWRIAELFHTPAAIRFACFEPLLEFIDTSFFEGLDGRSYWPFAGLWGIKDPAAEDGLVSDEFVKLDWVIAGPETGSGKRPYDLEWSKRI